ncbi:MAG: hypothetical protein GY772_25090 [bacterium]|nr:hypothetical protein [bacterium]
MASSLSQYESWKDRFCFLVLDGPSGYGKTRFSEHIAGDPRAFLCVDCAAAVEPNLRKSERGTHELILFDEGKPQMVVTRKKLFQASIDPVQLGASATNAYSYELWLHRVKMVIASNRWKEDMSLLGASDRAWLEANSVYCAVSEPLWEQ